MISRGLAYAPYADILWCETSTPDLAMAQRFADAIAHLAERLLKLCDGAIVEIFFPVERWRTVIGQQFTGIAIHSMWFNMFDLAHAYAQGEGMRHYVEKVQQPEFAARDRGYRSGIYSELVLFSRTGQRRHRRFTALDGGGDPIKIAVTASHRISRKWAPAILIGSPPPSRAVNRR
jgi:hypothetical protein